MRLSAIVFLLTVIMVHGFAGSLTAQQVTLSKVNADFEAVIEEIRQQTGYDFMVKKEIVQQAKPLTITVREASLESVLKQVVTNQNLTFKILDDIKMVVISEKPSNPPVISSEAEGRREISSVEAQQPIEIRGRLIDSLSRPVEGATIQVVADDGRGVRTNSDRNGGFTINAPIGATLRISSIGYETREVVVERSTVNVVMKIAVNDLDEIQVMAYGVTSKRFQTGNVTQINAKDIPNKYTLNNLSALQGLAPGLDIKNVSGMVGAATRIRVQGEGSIAFSRPPLYVIDGMPMSSYIGNNVIVPTGSPFGGGDGGFYRGNITDFVDINNIESVTVLRDAEATAIYGSRGGNGVIIITTKGRGQLGNHLEAALNYTIGTQPRRLDMMNTEEYLYMRRKALENDGITTLNPFQHADLLGFDQEAYTDWQEELFSNTTKNRNLNINFRTAGTRNANNLGLNVSDQNQFFGTGKFQSIKAHNRSQVSLFNNRWELDNSLNFFRETSDQVSADLTQHAVLLAPNFPREAFFAGAYDVRDGNGNLMFPSYSYNVMALTNSRQNEFGRNQFNNMLTSTLRLLPGLRHITQVGWSYANTEDKSYIDLSEASRVYNNPSLQSTSTVNNSLQSMRSLETYLTYRKHLKDVNLAFSATLGYSYNGARFRQDQVLYSGFEQPEFLENIAFANQVAQRRYANAEYVYKGYFLRSNLTLSERYLVNFSYRLDGSSRFAPENRWAGFYSVSAGWILSEEAPLKARLPENIFIKLRGSVGIAGNDGIPNYAYMNQYTYLNNAAISAGMLTPNNIYNPDYRWEKMQKYNIGADASWGRYVDLSINYNLNRASNQLLNLTMPAHLSSGGSSSQYINMDAVFHNTSWEFQLGGQPLASKWLDVRLRANLTLPNDELKAFPGLANAPVYRTYEVGKSVHGANGYRRAGIDPTTGLYTYLDAEGNAVANTAQAELIRYSTQPRWYGNLMVDIDFKYFTVGAQVYAYAGRSANLGYVFSSTGGNVYFPGSSNSQFFSNQERRFLDNWDTNPSSRYQRFVSGTSVSSADPDRTAYRYLRLNNVWVSLPLRSVWKSGPSGALRFQAGNVLLASDSGTLNYEAVENTTLPPLTTYTLSLQVNL